MFSLNDKVALVIGGSGKIGFAIACALSNQGARVFVVSRSGPKNNSVAEAFERCGIEHLQMDASQEGEVGQVLETIRSQAGKIDILVNSSAWRPLTNFMDDSVENWNDSIKVNSAAIFCPTRMIGRHMAEQGGGSIINVSSIYGITAPPMSIYQDCDFETEPDYPFLKAGCIGLSRYFSSYFAKDRVRVNVVAPGGVFNDQPEGFTRRYNEKTPLGRMASPVDIAGAVVYLASDAASYVTGVVLPIDGGWTAV